MQNGKNKPKSLGEEGSEVSVQMGKNEKERTMNKKFGIRKTVNPGTKTCAGSYRWYRGRSPEGVPTAWARDPADAQTWPSKDAANQFLKSKNLSGKVVEIR